MKLGIHPMSGKFVPTLLLAAPLLVVVGFLLVPIGQLLIQGVDAAIGARTPLPTYFWPHLLRVTGNTFVLGFITTVSSLAISLPLAFLLAKTDVFGSRFWLALLTLPLIAPPFIMAFATLLLYGRSGSIAILVQDLGIRMPLIFGLPGLVLTQITVSIPYATFILAAGLQGVPRHIEESAVSMGVRSLRIWVDLVLPCVYPHLIISGLMIFLMSIGDVGSPLVIGGGFSVIASEIYTNFLSLLNDERIPLVISLWIILLSFLLLALVNILLRLAVKRYRPGTHPVVTHLGRWRVPASAGVALVVIWLMLPFIVILVQSFGTISTYELSPRIWSLANYTDMVRSPDLIRDTLSVALIATPVMVLMSLIFGHTLYIRRKWRFLDFIMVLPFVLPGVVLAVGVLESYAGLFTRSRVIPFFALLVLTIVVRRLPYSLKMLEAGFLSADPRREEVATSLGNGRFTAFLRITLPQLKPFLLGALVIGLVKTATELSASLILAPPDWRSLSLGIVYFIDQGQLSRASAMSVILVAVVGAGTFSAAFWLQGSRRAGGPEPEDSLERLVLGRTPMALPRAVGRKASFRRPARRRLESLLVVDGKSGIVDASRTFLRLVGADTVAHLKSESSFSVLFFGDREVLELFTSREPLVDRATYIVALDGTRIPVILHAHVVTSEAGEQRGYLYCRRILERTRKAREYRRLRERIVTAEHAALKAQITPHFLFNTLNSVVHLIDTEPAEARQVVQSLADLYRYTLSSTKKNAVTVTEEIETVRNYLSIEKARFGARLRFTIHVHPVVRSAWIPPMLLQPIVENAVSHGRNDAGDIDISVSVSRQGDETMIRVSDRGTTPFDPATVSTGVGTGLKNVEGRMFALYRRKVIYERRTGGGLIVTIAIPDETR